MDHMVARIVEDVVRAAGGEQGLDRGHVVSVLPTSDLPSRADCGCSGLHRDGDVVEHADGDPEEIGDLPRRRDEVEPRADDRRWTTSGPTQ